MRHPKIMRFTAIACAILATSCASNPNNQSANPLGQLFSNEDPCSDNARNIGIAGGVLAGLILGNAIGNGKSESLAVGAAVGGLIGGLIGADMDRKRCELSKVAKQYDLDITFSPITANGEVATGSTMRSQPIDSKGTTSALVGTTLTVRDKGGTTGHFESGSDRLTPKAREYFSAIAAQYSAEKMLEGQTDAKRRVEISKQIAQRRLFLMGHTDDTGSSSLNASLSERRARAVADFLKQHGIREDALYFQGAGETLPVADNRTEAGRAENRRVEIVEVADESSFKKYLEARKPNYQFYRSTDESVSVASPVATGVRSSKPSTRQAAATTVTSKKGQLTPATNTPAGASKSPTFAVNFGGVPYSAAVATLNVGSVIPEKARFSLISTAQADDSVVLSDCTHDRPRAAGAVKSLKDGSTYKTNEHLPQLYGKTWAGDVNGNLVVINRLRVLRDGGTPANLPELKVYAHYKPDTGQKPTVNEEPPVNSYLVGQGVLYRMFPRGDAGLKCVDLLFAVDGSTSARAGKLIYGAGSSQFVADFKPQMQ